MGRLGGTEGGTLIGAARSESVPVSETLRDWTRFDADTGKDLAVEVREDFIPDFSNWKSHDAFESAFARLKKDLEAENSTSP